MIYRKKRVPTVNLERHLLHYLTAGKVVLQGNLALCREEWFTCESRLMVFRMIGSHYEESRDVLTETQFHFRLETLLPGEENEIRRQDVKAEYRIIREIAPDDEPAAVIRRLNEAQLVCDTEELLNSIRACIEKGDIDAALSRLRQGSLDLRRPDEKRCVVSLWEETREWIQEVTNRRDFPEKHAGLPTGFRKFDECTGGLFPAELTVIFGLSGKGKSTLMKQIGANVRKRGYNVLHCGNEEDEFQIRTKYTSVETGVKYSHWKRGRFSDAELRRFEEYSREQRSNASGKLYVYNFPQQTDATMIERRLTELNMRGIRIDLVIVDYLDLMASIRRAYNENDEGGRVTGDLKQIAINFNIPVLVCTQAASQAEKQELADHPFLTASDVFGTKRKVHSANTLIGIVNQTATAGAGERGENCLKRHRIVICVPKNRDGPVFTFRLIIEVETGRVVEDDEDDPNGADQEARAHSIMRESLLLETKRASGGKQPVSNPETIPGEMRQRELAASIGNLLRSGRKRKR